MEVVEAVTQCPEEEYGVSCHLLYAGIGLIAVALQTAKNLSVSRVRVVGGS